MNLDFAPIGGFRVLAQDPTSGVQRFVDACQDSADVWRKLRELDWEHSLRKHKTHLEPLETKLCDRKARIFDRIILEAPSEHDVNIREQFQSSGSSDSSVKWPNPFHTAPKRKHRKVRREPGDNGHD